MTERRLFCPETHSLDRLLAEGEVRLSSEEAHYARGVLRLGDGAPVLALDGSGRTLAASLVHHGRADATLVVDGQTARLEPTATARDVHLILPIAKGERADWLVEKATEMGVCSLIVTRFARSVVLAEGPNRWQRWHRLAKAASRQARHGRLPSLSSASSLSEATGTLKDDRAARLVAHPATDAVPLPMRVATAQQVYLVIGPEGGLDPDELQMLAQRDYTATTLGPHILRMETAALVALAACLVTPVDESPVKEP